MSEDADRFRKRAEQCRRLAKDARDAETRAQLVLMAKELDEEADIIEGNFRQQTT